MNVTKANVAECLQLGFDRRKSAEEIQTFCSTTFGIDFPMTSKVDVKDADAHPFYKWAEAELGEPAVPVWNFHKILIGKSGEALQAFGPRTEPQDTGLVAAIEAAL